MNREYIITEFELMEKGLDLNEYTLEGTFNNAIINLALDIAVSRCCYLNDNINGEVGLEEFIGNDVAKIRSFKKLQYRIIYNLIFMAEDNPVDLYVDTIIVHEMRCGKINGFQKGLFYKYN